MQVKTLTIDIISPILGAINEPFEDASESINSISNIGADLIACEQLNRVWRGAEKDPIFATIIIDLWEKFTNLKAKKIYGNK